MSIKHTAQKWNAEIYSLFNGWKRLDDYNPYGEDNLQYATADGMPSWYTVNIRAGVSVIKPVLIQLALENIFDKNYRHFASGISAPGRNFVLSIKASF